MMDWYLIEYLYPKSFKRFKDAMFPTIGIVSLSTLEYYDVKKLYRFFDKEGVYLNVEMYNTNTWLYTISVSNGIVFTSNGVSKPSRDDIEILGFTECFKLLDNIAQ